MSPTALRKRIQAVQQAIEDGDEDALERLGDLKALKHDFPLIGAWVERVFDLQEQVDAAAEELDFALENMAAVALAIEMVDQRTKAGEPIPAGVETLFEGGKDLLEDNADGSVGGSDED
jgi:hypothetical protein